MTNGIEGIARPHRLWSRAEVLARPSAAPAEPGVYGWFFRQLPGIVDADDCVVSTGATLLYVGIAPRRHTVTSRQTLRSRLQTHYRGNAEASTLRLTLGCLLEEELGIRLQRSASGRFTFRDGENALSGWMASNALVAWVTDQAPWDLEIELLRSLDLPLNLEANVTHLSSLHPARAACGGSAPRG